MGDAFQIGPWLAQPSLNAISQDGRAFRLEPNVMEVLVCLAGRAEETVSKEKLIRSVWPDTFATGDVLNPCGATTQQPVTPKLFGNFVPRRKNSRSSEPSEYLEISPILIPESATKKRPSTGFKSPFRSAPVQCPI